MLITMNSSVFSLLHQLQSFFSQAQTKVVEKHLQELPEEAINRLKDITAQLPNPASDITTIEQASLSHLKKWQEIQDANHLVILGSPVTNFADLIPTSFPKKQLHHVQIIYPFANFEFREQPSEIKQNLQKVIEEKVNHRKNNILANSEQVQHQIIIIPCLEQCFLRCIGGWNGIIWLREHIVNTPHCFWLIGCNDWSWTFLNYVCNMNDYLEQTIVLPKLTGDDLQEWLTPILESLIPQEKENLPSLFWETLASLSGGQSQTVIQLLLQSLRMSIPEEEEAKDQPINEFKLITPFLPSLPSISAEDRYLLHSLILHGEIARSRLALSLGEKEEVIQAQVQSLLKQKLIVKQENKLKINPLYYPKIKDLLYQNNYLTGQD